MSSVSLAGMADLQIADHFGSLLKLQDLSIKYCKIRTLPPRSFVGLSSRATSPSRPSTASRQ